ncbi:MAG: hypothetical protein JRF63_15015 [Deltaproteobacteria bacterium]|nr:hypothetical protein [Deltaproteobacteria bacterium]
MTFWFFEVGPEARHHAIDVGSIVLIGDGRGAVVGGALQRIDGTVIELEDLGAKVIRQGAVLLDLGPEVRDL